MQRLGFCKAALVFCGAARSGSQMAEVLRSALQESKDDVPYDTQFEQWLQQNREEKSLQMLYVYGHPSKSGWLSRLAFDEYMEFLPIKLGLVTQSYDLTDFGAVLLHGIMSEDEKAAFRAPSSCNPLILGTDQQVFFLYQLLEADGDFLIPFCNALLSRFGAESISYLDAGSVVPSVIAQVIDTFAASVYTQADREQLARLKATKDRIEDEIKKHIEKQGSGSRREQTTIPRLEWLVDLGLAVRLESRTWKFTDRGIRLLKNLCQVYQDSLRGRFPENVVRTLLDSEFYSIAVTGYVGSSPELIQHQDLLKFLHPSYLALSGLTGYCLLRPLVLHRNSVAIRSQSPQIVEYDSAKGSLPDLYQSHPGVLSYTIDRFNTDYQIRLRVSPGL